MIAQFFEASLELACIILHKSSKEFQKSLTDSLRNTERTELRCHHDNLLETLKMSGFYLSFQNFCESLKKQTEMLFKYVKMFVIILLFI